MPKGFRVRPYVIRYERAPQPLRAAIDVILFYARNHCSCDKKREADAAFSNYSYGPCPAHRFLQNFRGDQSNG